MRPPQNAGENRGGNPATGRGASPFNEAPAKRGGKLEDRMNQSGGRATPFNEAPAKRGGKPLVLGVAGQVHAVLQ